MDILKPLGTSTDAPTAHPVLLARTLTGVYVGIKLDVDRPKTFDSVKARERWDDTMSRSAEKLKSRIESGDIDIEHVKDILDFDVNVPEDEKQLVKDGAVQSKNYKLR